MQFNIIALLAATSAMVSAAPVDNSMSVAAVDSALLARTTQPKACCPKGKKSSCTPCGAGESCPAGQDEYSNCKAKSLLGLIQLGVVVCNVLNGDILSNNDLDISLLNGLLG